MVEILSVRAIFIFFFFVSNDSISIFVRIFFTI